MLGQFERLSAFAQAAEHKRQTLSTAKHLRSTEPPKTETSDPVDTQPRSTLRRWTGQLLRLHLLGEIPQIHELPLFTLKRRAPEALALGRPILPKITGHLMKHQSITVSRDVRQKPVHAVEQKGF